MGNARVSKRRVTEATPKSIYKTSSSAPPEPFGAYVEAGCKAARLVALNVLAVARKHLGSLDKVTRIVRLGVSVATSADESDQPKVADAASELLQDVFGKAKSPCRLVYGVASLPLGTQGDIWDAQKDMARALSPPGLTCARSLRYDRVTSRAARTI